jgi:hypothetical protein
MRNVNHGRTDHARGIHRWIFVVSLCLAALSADTILKAAPITLAFDAQVTSIVRSPLSDFDIPFPIAVGDTIRGRFSFEPSPLGHLGTQETGLRIDVGDVVLESPTFEIKTSLNQVPPGGPLEFSDFISVSCSLLATTGAQCDPGSVPGAESVRWRTLMTLGGMSPLLEANILPGDIGIWNAFTGRGLTLSFTPTEGDGSVRVATHVGLFIVVPEPSSQLAVGIALLLVFTRLHARVRHRSFKSSSANQT